MSQAAFRLQSSVKGIYRVGKVVSGTPQALYQTIQAAINQAIADGYQLGTDHAVIEIYPGIYNENLTLSPNINLVGYDGYVSNNNSSVVINGRHTINLNFPGGTLDFKNLSFKENGGISNPVFTATGASPTNVRWKNCYFEKNFSAAESILTMDNASFCTYSFEDCSGFFRSNSGAAFRNISSGGVELSISNDSLPTTGDTGWFLQAVTSGIVPNFRFVLTSTLASMTVLLKNMSINAAGTRLFALQNAGDSMVMTSVAISFASDAGNVIKFISAASVVLRNTTIEISGAGIQTGIPLIASNGGDQASGTFTFGANPLIGNTVTVGAVIFTFGPGPGQVPIGATANDTALNLANQINGVGTANGYYAVNLFAGSNIVTVYAIQTGVAGNAIIISSSTASIVASGATLSGGVNGFGGGLNYGSCTFGFNFVDAGLSVQALTPTLSSI